MKELMKSLAEFQQEVPVIHQNTQGYGYTYSSLSEILTTINPLLKKHGLGFTQLIDGDSIKTILFHVETGQSFESSVHIIQDVKLNKMNDYQVLGSAITYLRRYALSAMLGIVTDKDNDAAGEQTPKQPQPKKAKAELKEGSFEKMKTAIAGGNYTVKQAEQTYNLTIEQLADLTEVEESAKAK